MENNEASVYDINDLSPTEILNEGDDRSNTNMNNNGNKKNKNNTRHMVNNKDRTTASNNNTGHLTNSKVLNNNDNRHNTSKFKTVLQNELFKTVIKTMASKYKSDLHKRDTLPRNLKYQLDKYRLPNDYFDAFNTGSPKDNLSEHINLIELEQIRTDFNTKVTNVLENNKNLYLEEAQIDGFYTDNIIPDAVNEGFDKLTKSDNTTSIYLSEIKPVICKETVNWFNTTLKQEYGLIDADYRLNKNIRATNNKNITPSNNTSNNIDNNKRTFQRFIAPDGHCTNADSKITPYNNEKSTNRNIFNSSSSNRQFNTNNSYESYDYDHFDRHVQPRYTGTYQKQKLLNLHSAASNIINCNYTAQYKIPPATQSDTSNSSTTPVKYTPYRIPQHPLSSKPQTREHTDPQTRRPLRNRKNRCKRNDTTRFYKYQTKLKKLPFFFHRISNKGIHNFSQKRLTLEEEGVLSLGLKFIIRPQPNTLNELMQCYQNFVRLIRIKNQMLGCNGYSINSAPSAVYVPNKNFVPNKGGQVLENYITTILSNLLASYNNLPLAYKVKQHIPKIFNITINNLKRDSTIKICSADKNLGVCIVDRDWYEQEALRQLQDVHTYTRIQHLPDNMYFITKITAIFNKHNKQNKKLLLYFLQPTQSNNKVNNVQQEQSHPKIGRFYLTIKIHKEPIIGRPIVATIESVTYFISSHLDRELQSVMKALSTYLRNTNDLIIDIETNPIFNTLNELNALYTADIKDMYPSINIADGLSLLKVAIQEYNSTVDINKQIHTEFIIDLAHFVLTNNYFIFGKETYWLQISGTAMGTPFAVTFACIYIGQLEKQLFKILQHNNRLPIYYRRYIDDIFAIFKNAHDMQHYHNTFNTLRQGKIQLIITHTGKTVTFMDLTITINANNKVDVKIYQKPQNSYLYLPPSSFHQRHIFENTIIAELKRYKLKCTNASDYEDIKIEFYNRLLTRGYNTNYLNTVFDKSTTITREHIILNLISKRYKTKEYNNDKPLVFVTTNTPLTRHLQFHKILEPTPELQSNSLCQLLFTKHKGSYQPITAHRRTKNLKDQLTQSTYNHELKTLTNKQQY